MINLRPLLALCAAMVVCLSVQAAAAPRSVQGMVSKVTDGDSLWLTPASASAIQVRLRDIDAPESCQPWGAEARKALSDLALNKVATLQISGRDAYGRMVGVLLIEDLNVGRFLVENGHAWSVRTRWDQGPLVKQEKMARALTRGLHAMPGAVQPQEFRRSHGPCAAGETAAPPGRGAAPSQMSSPSPVATVATAAATAGGTAAPAGFRCDGRMRCSQMTSCEEAKYFLAHCPNVKMDGGRHNGIPCEKQWCAR